MTHQHRRRCASLILALSLGCGGDAGEPGEQPVPALYLVNADHVELAADSIDVTAEGTNLLAALESLGVPIDTFSELSAEGLSLALTERRALFLPKLIDGNAFAAALTPAAESVLVAWVREDGHALYVTGAQTHLAWINSAFGHSITAGNSYATAEELPRTQYSYPSLPISLPANSNVSTVTTASIPTGTFLIGYRGPAGVEEASLVRVNEGDGEILLFGWDWYNAQPRGIRDGGWNEVLGFFTNHLDH